MTDEQKVVNKNRIKDEPEKEGLSGECKIINNINVSNNNKDNEIETGKLNFDDGYEEGEESEHISEDPIDQQETN